MRILVTGASGFVGQALVSRLLAEPDHVIRAAYRSPPASPAAKLDICQVGDLGPHTDWATAVAGIDVVIHCAARVHVMHDTDNNPLAAYRRSNVEGTLQLAQAAVAAGCKQFIFLSSIKVNGERTEPGQPFSASTPPAPRDPYGQSKLEAEQALLALAEQTGMSVTIIRPVLVYGPGVRANFRSMMQWLQRGIPLPLGAVRNQRSLVALDNLVDLIITCIDHPAARNQTFLVSDGEDLSTTDLLRRTSNALGCRACLLPVPDRLMQIGARLLGKGGVAQRLFGSLQVDITHTRSTLDWQPPVSVDEALRRVAQDFTQGTHR